MKILFISPLPPPIHGHSLAGKMAIKYLSKRANITAIDSAIDKSFKGNKHASIISPKRLFKIAALLLRDFPVVWFKRYDVVYLNVGISLRDFLRYSPYMISSIIKREPYIIHTHGSTFGKMYNAQNNFIKCILRYLCSKASTIVVLGDSLINKFEGIVDLEKIEICQNGVESQFRATPYEIEQKINRDRSNRINLLFLTNIMRAKGILELMDMFDTLPEHYTLYIAGGIESDLEIASKFNAFIERHRTSGRVVWHGVVQGEVKRKLFLISDIFILPSKNEGQPISILEAYSMGCCVVTDQSVGGISDIFKDGVNGVSIDHKSPHSIAKGVKSCNLDSLARYMRFNYNFSSCYSEDSYGERVYNLCSKVLSH